MRETKKDLEKKIKQARIIIAALILTEEYDSLSPAMKKEINKFQKSFTSKP